MPPLEVLAWILLLLLLLRILSKLTDLHTLLFSDAPPPPRVLRAPAVLLRKAWVFAHGIVYLFLSGDKVSSARLKGHPNADELENVTKEVRIIFVRHGESIWNLVFNRGFGPSFPLRWLTMLLYEAFLLPFDDSAFLDSPLSQKGLEQCAQLKAFLKQPCKDAAAYDDFACLTAGLTDGSRAARTPPAPSLLVSSQLRRAAATLAIALEERLEASKEPIMLHSACQEITRNVDSQSLAPSGEAPTLPSGGGEHVRLDGVYNEGNKSLSFTGYHRLTHFAQWAAEHGGERTLIVAGHSLWFRSFFQLFLPKSSEHVGKRRKMVNCGTVAFTLQTGTNKMGELRQRIVPESIVVVYGGFASK